MKAKFKIGDKVTPTAKLTDLISSFWPGCGFVGEIIDYMDIKDNGFFYIVRINGCNCPARENEIKIVEEEIK